MNIRFLWNFLTKNIKKRNENYRNLKIIIQSRILIDK